MIDGMAQRIASFLVERGAVASEDADVQVYGLQVILSTSINLLVSLLFSMLMGQFLFGLSLLAAFMLLRRFTGGYHANSYLGCFVSLQAMMLLGFALQRLFCSGLSAAVVYGMLAVSLLLVYLLAPIDHANKPSTPVSQIKFRNLSRGLAAAMAALACLGCVTLGPTNWVVGIAAGLLSTGVLLVMAKIQKKGGALS